MTTAPTTTSTGVKTFTCLTCGETKTEEIAKLPEESKPSKPADTTTEGKKDDTKPSTDKKKIHSHLQTRRMIQNRLQTRRITLQW